MANPANLLLDIFESWNNPGLNTKSARSDNDLVIHRRAMGYIGEIEQILDLLDAEEVNTSVYRRYLIQWVAIIMNYPNSWTSTMGEIDRVSLDHLVNLANQSRDVVPEVDTEQFALLDAYLEAVEFALANDSSLPKFSKIHVRTVVSNIRTAMDNITVVGDFEFQTLIHLLFSLLASSAARSQQRERWDRWHEHFVWPFVYDSVKFSAGYGIAQLQAAGVFNALPGVTQ